MRHLIIGSSYAAVGAVEAIRQVDLTGEIVMIADEPHGAYCRPLLPHYLKGESSLEDIYYRPKEFFDKLRVETHFGVSITRIDPAGHRVQLQDGRVLAFDRLLISVGGKPTIPPTPGSDAKGVFTLTRLDDARQISEWVRDVSAKNVVIVGAGLICLNTLRAFEEMHITLVELMPRVMGLALDEAASGIVEQRLKEHEIDVRTSTTVAEILKNDKGQVRGVRLSTGVELSCQMVLFAVGVRPSLALLQESGIQVGRGIVVDERMQTSAADIYAAGDVVEAFDILNQERRVIAILPLAYEQGRVAGFNMAGRVTCYAGGIPLNSMSLYGLPLMTMGITLTDKRLDLTALVYRDNAVFRKLVFEGDRLVGVILIGDVKAGGILTGLIKSQKPVAVPREQLLSGDFLGLQVAREASAARKIGAWGQPTA